MYSVRSDIGRSRRRGVEGSSISGELTVQDAVALEGAVCFTVLDGERIEVPFEVSHSQGRHGRNRLKGDVFVRLAAEIGAERANKLVELALRNLPGEGGEGVGESREWVRRTVSAAARVRPGGLLGILHDHPQTLAAFRDERYALSAAERERRVSVTLDSSSAARGLLGRSWDGTHPELSNSSDPLVRTMHRSLVDDRDVWLEALREEEPVALRAMLLHIGSTLPTEVLDAFVLSDHTAYVRAAALHALREVDAVLAGVRAVGVLAQARDVSPLPPDLGRLCEVAVTALDHTQRVRLAQDADAFWLWQVTAVGTLNESEDAVALAAVATSRRSHPLARIAAVARTTDQAALARLCSDKDARLASAATTRLRELSGEQLTTLGSGTVSPHFRAEYTGDPSRIRVAAIDVDGTLARDDGTIHERAVRGVQTFADSGGHVVITTTRAAESALSVARQVLQGREGTVVCDDGMTILDVTTGAILRGPTPLGVDVPPGTERDQHKWVIVPPDTGVVSMSDAARLARTYSSERGSVAVAKAGKAGALALEYATDKGSTLEDVAGFLGVSLAECAVFGDGKVDLPMFEKVLNAGGLTVAVANAQPSIIDSPSIGMVCHGNDSGGIGEVLESLSRGALPLFPAEEAAASARRSGHAREVYSQYAITDGGAVREALREAGISHLVDVERGLTHHGGTPAVPGHVTFAHPNDFKGQAMPVIPDAEVSIVGYVDTPDLSAIVCAVDSGSGPTTTRADGKTFHVTLRTRVGVPPNHTNTVLLNGWTTLETPLPLPTTRVERRSRR